MIDKLQKIMITGGTGFLGSFVTKQLAENGYVDVIPLSSKDGDLTDVNDADHLVWKYAPTAVIHLAARVGGIGANRANPGRFAYDNLAMGLNVIDKCRKYGTKKLVIAGTICAYPKFTPIPFKEANLWNGYPEETNAPYGLAKKMLLVLAQGYRQQYGSNFVYVLPVNLYGPGDNFDLNNSHVIPAMIRKFHAAKIANAPSVTLWGDGTPTREFLYVEDCAKAFVKVMEGYDSPEPMNIGSGMEISMKDLANKIKGIAGYEGNIIWDAAMPNGQPRRCLDTSRAEQEIGWKAETSLEDGLKKTYDWYTTYKEPKE